MRQIALEITKTSVRALLAEGTLAQPRLRTLVVQPLTGTPDGETVRRALAGLAPTKASVVFAIPREQAITRLLKLPTTDQQELTQMAALAAKAQLPYPPEQAVFDIYVVDQQGSTSTVQVIAYHKDQITRYMAILRQAGLHPSCITPSTWGILSWYQRVGRSAHIPEPAMVVNIDADRTDLALIRQGRLLFSRSLDQGSGQWQTHSGAVELLVEEVERSLTSLRKELPGVEASHIMLTGLGPLEDWKRSFETRLGKPVSVKHLEGTYPAPVSSASPAAARAAREEAKRRRRAAFPPAPPDVASGTQASPQQTSPAVVLGLAMVDPQSLINLVPVMEREAQHHRRRIRELVLTGVLLLAALILGVGVLSAHVSHQVRLNSHMAGLLDELEGLTEQTEWQERDVTLVEQTIISRRWLAGTLAELFRLTPAQIQYESLVFERKRGELTLRGSAPATRQVLNYIRGLERSNQWAHVELRYSARRGTSAGARTDFELVLHRET